MLPISLHVICIQSMQILDCTLEFKFLDVLIDHEYGTMHGWVGVALL